MTTDNKLQSKIALQFVVCCHDLLVTLFCIYSAFLHPQNCS